MTSVAAITVDGVLRNLVGGTPIREGIGLYHSLCSRFNVVLLRSENNDAEFEAFLLSENLDTHSNVLPWTSWDDGGRVGQASRVRRGGYDVSLVVEGDPGVCRELFLAGLNVLHFMHALYARPEWRPDALRGQRAWDVLVAEQHAQAALKAADKRMGGEPG